MLPSSVQGGCPFRESRNIWLSLAQQLEHAHFHGLPLVGIMLDIRKAFNALPRMPIWFALSRMHFPREILHAWRFRVRSSVSSGLHSTVGLPEGCGMSVFGMIVVDYLLDLWITSQYPSARVWTFIDDWQIVVRDVQLLEEVWLAVGKFTDMLDLAVDESKTFAWSAQASERQVLRKGRLKLQLSTQALGIHHNFCRRLGNRTVQQRIQAMQATWQRLRASLSPYKFKLQALAQMAWPRALHGISAVHLGRQHFVSLRASAIKSLKVNRKGTSPILRLATHGMRYDPELWAMMQTLRDLRECDRFPEFLTDLGLYRQAEKTSNGPIGVLVARLEVIGWQLRDDGRFQDKYGLLDIFNAAWEELVLRIKLAWPETMANEVLHRSSLAGLHRIDLFETAELFKHFDDGEQEILRCHMDGTLYTQNGRAQFQDDTTAKCPWCSEKDGFFHRVWECEAEHIYLPN